VLLSLAACGQQSDLAWVPPKTFTPAQVDKIFVDSLGVNDSVAILPVGTSPSAIQKQLRNAGPGTASGAYQVREVVEQLAFRFPPARFEVVDTVFDSSFPGPAPIAPGAAAPFSANVTVPATCGLFRETLIADAGGALAETDETNNTQVDWFFIPSNQQFNITVDTILDQFTHDRPAPVNTHNFRVLSAAVPPVTQVLYTGFSFVATEGSTATTLPAPGGPGPVPLPAVLRMLVTPQVHAIPGGFQPTITGKVTVISLDGCVVKQQSARAFIEHEVR
jgi:hypothetical protein